MLNTELFFFFSLGGGPFVRRGELLPAAAGSWDITLRHSDSGGGNAAGGSLQRAGQRVRQAPAVNITTRFYIYRLALQG